MNRQEYTTMEVATLATCNGRRVTARQIARLCKKGRIPARKLGTGVRTAWLIPADDAQRWLDAWFAN